MDSPSAQLVDEGMADFGGPPSSPFVSEVDHHSRPSSRPSSKQLNHSIQSRAAEVVLCTQSPEKFVSLTMDVEEDKENLSQQDPTLARLFASPKKHDILKPDAHETRDGTVTSKDTDLMPPPSSRKISSPQKTPLRSSRSGARTPRSMHRGNSFESATPSRHATTTPAPAEDLAGPDDTCFSAFSEIPDMTTFAKLGQSPSKQSEVFHTPRADLGPTPRTSRKRASPSRSPSPTPRSRRVKSPFAHVSQDGTTSFLIDFTQQIEGVTAHRPMASPPKSATESNLLQFMNNQRSPNKTPRTSYATPNKQSSLLNLLDFELPPAPTPRSVPTITVRELESLKSSYLSQISSLKATLSGREAEVESLKKAIGDAERRAGEAQESLREEKCRREQVEEEKAGWEKRGQEVEQLLRNVKEEVIKGEAEKEDMAMRLEEADKRIEETEKKVEDAEARATKAEERFADALAAKASSTEGGDDAGSAAQSEETVQKLVAAQIDAKIEAVSRELHAVYKEKHERKVATLKKSYEARAEKKMAELQSRVSSLEEENKDLQSSKDETFTGPFSGNGGGNNGDASVLNIDNAELKTQLEEQKAHLARLQTEMEASKSHQQQLERELQQERIEKGDLVAAVDEMLALQSEQPPTPGPNPVQGAMNMVQDFRKSISRPSSLRALAGSGVGAAGESKIGRGVGGPALARCSGLAPPAAGGAGKSKMLANIERMGRTASKDGSTGL